MFGFSFSELVVVILVAVIVMGPKDLPKMLRRAGQWAGKIRRMAADLRAQSGIDEALRTEGLADDIAEIRKLARGELDAVRVAATISNDADANRPAATISNDAATRSGDDLNYARGDDFYVVREREYPRDGADNYGALPDNAIVYAEGLPKSPWNRDPLYVLGDEDAALPPEPEADLPPDETAEAGLPDAPADRLTEPEAQRETRLADDVTPEKQDEQRETLRELTGAPQRSASATLIGVGLADLDRPTSADASPPHDHDGEAESSQGVGSS